MNERVEMTPELRMAVLDAYKQTPTNVLLRRWKGLVMGAETHPQCLDLLEKEVNTFIGLFKQTIQLWKDLDPDTKATLIAEAKLEKRYPKAVD